MGKKKLDEAIKTVEKAGGIIMMPSDPDLPEISDEDVENAARKREYEERKQEAFEEFDKALGSKNFNYGTVEDICYENGIDMDDIEEYIHGHY